MGITKRAAAVCAVLVAGTLLACGDDNDRAIPQAIREPLGRAGIQTLRQKEALVDFTLPFLDGAEKTLSAYKGRVVFLNFWATWCPPCREEMPSMETLYQRFREQGLEFIAVDIQESGDAVQAFITAKGLHFPVALDESGSVAARYGVSAIPTTYIIDREGFVIAGVRGARRWDTPQVYEAFEALLK
ncbi:MAG: TlpA family protein disulfide reductase [Spirochaetaceae bacterium]|jgi:peroxiredoxin|nr:TlpA family protein disulfide reductase [Spirochaetaceae bacterium]